MRKVLFTVLALNMILEGLTSVRLVSLPFQKEDFDAALHGGFVLYGYAALAAAASIVWFAKYSYANQVWLWALACSNISYLYGSCLCHHL